MKSDIQTLRAKVAALEILLEMLVVDALALTTDPVAVGNEIVKRAYATEATLGEDCGPVVLQVTEAITSLMDRAVTRAVRQKKARRRSKP